nr:MAG TPA: hypothetical protein [Caudoviricetes sp.]
MRVSFGRFMFCSLQIERSALLLLTLESVPRA